MRKQKNTNIEIGERMPDRKDMTAKQIARSVWEEMKERHEKELVDLQRNHCKDVIRVVTSQMAERENMRKELSNLLN